MNRRKEIDQQEFDQAYLQKMMRMLFPRRNDCASSEELGEVVSELKLFSIITKLQVRLFLKKYRRQLLEIDKEQIDSYHQMLFREYLGENEYVDTIRRQYWFCYPGLIRAAMEIEFGVEYDNFSNERDRI